MENRPCSINGPERLPPTMPRPLCRRRTLSAMSPATAAGYSPLECLMLIPPIATTVFSFLNTPDYLCLRNTSRTMRIFVQSNARFFRNLVFVGRGGERWLDLLESNHRKAFDFETQPAAIREVLRQITEQRQRREFQVKKMEDRYVKMVLDSLSVLSGEWRDVTWRLWTDRSMQVERELDRFPLRLHDDDPPKIPSLYYPGMMARHFFQVVGSLPIGRNIGTIVLDGTGIDTPAVQLVMARFACTLRGLSVKNCRNVDIWIFADWLLDSLYRHIPLALRWLRVWGIGGLPSHFQSDDLVDPVMPLSPHPDDALVQSAPTVPAKPKLLPNLLPREWLVNYLCPLLCPMFKRGAQRATWIQALRTTVLDQLNEYEARFGNAPDPFPYWNAPIVPLGDVNPIISLLAISRFLKVKLDFSFCTAREYCWSFLLGSFTDHMYLYDEPASYRVSVGSHSFVFPQPAGNRNEILHTHSLAEVGARRMEGGQRCHVCGLWEDSASPHGFDESDDSGDGGGNSDDDDGDDITFDIAGRRTGPGIGEGRISVGNLCQECRQMQTCDGCQKFVCHNCLFSDWNAEPNPCMIVDPSELEHLRFVCSAHGGECVDCMDASAGRYFECEECDNSFCLRCEPPSGAKVTTDVYGGELAFVAAAANTAPPSATFARKTAYVRSRLCLLKPFKVTVNQSPDDLNGLKTLAEIHLFEICDGCDSAICFECISRFHPRGNESIRKNISVYARCSRGCGRVFCSECEARTVFKCRFCDACVCDLCLWEHRAYGTPGLGGDWCREPGCLEKSGLVDFRGLQGPWEDGWDGKSGQAGLEDPLAVMVTALRDSGHLPHDVAEESVRQHFLRSEDAAFRSLRAAAEQLSSYTFRQILADSIRRGAVAVSPAPPDPGAPADRAEPPSAASSGKGN